MDKLDLVVEMLKDVKDTVTKNSEHLAEMKVDVELNRKDLELHMQRSDSLEAIVEYNNRKSDERVTKLEKKLTPSYLFKLIVTVAGGLGTIAGAIYGISRFF